MVTILVNEQEAVSAVVNKNNVMGGKLVGVICCRDRSFDRIYRGTAERDKFHCASHIDLDLITLGRRKIRDAISGSGGLTARGPTESTGEIERISAEVAE